MKKTILVLGAGRSSAVLIDYLSGFCDKEGHLLTVGDINLAMAKERTQKLNANAIVFSTQDLETAEKEVAKAFIVVSLLPARFHPIIAKLCLKQGKHLVTASYLSPEMESFNAKAKSAGLIFLNEIGLDPGIDHLSAVKLIQEIQEKGGKVVEFESFTGGLVAVDDENNPWKYKLTWNPRNVVLAGQGKAVKFLHNGRYKYIPYHRLFRRTERIDLDGIGRFEGYANRDSLKYQKTYGLDDIKTMYRGTLRRPGFCKAWNCLVSLGLTDDSFKIEHSKGMTHRDFTNSFLSYHPSDSVELKVMQYLKIDQDDVDLWEKLTFLGLFSDEIIELDNATPAQILQAILEKKWMLEEDDKDRIVMWHKLVYELDGDYHRLESQMQCIGTTQDYTAMAKTVGLPAAIATKLIIQEKIKGRGVLLPIQSEWFQPILTELEKNGISFTEKDEVIDAKPYL